MIEFDPSELDSWASTASANVQFPRLIRKLILATVPTPSLLSMPSDSSVWLEGWDGLLRVDNGNSLVPKGVSTWEGWFGWELSARKDISDKATEDYKKRTENSKGLDTTEATFVFATPRRWTGKEDWIKKRHEERNWREIRVFDATDIAEWLEQLPAVASWFARLIGKLPDTGIVCLDEWWEGWAWSTKPQICPELVLAGRQKQAKEFQNWFAGTAACLHIQGETLQEVLAFSAAVSHLPSCLREGNGLLAKAIVVETPEAWRSLERHSRSLILIRNFSGNVSSRVAIQNKHHVLIPIDRTEGRPGSGFTLPRLGRDETEAALVQMGLTKSRSQLLSQKTARHLSVLRRMLLDESGVSRPEWAGSSPNHTLVATMLIGQWEDREGDRELVARLADKPYTKVDQELTVLANIADAPVVKIGARWSFISREEAWYLLAPFLTSSNVDLFTSMSIEVLRRKSPKFDLPPQERYLATFKGVDLPYSDTLLEGITVTLALMGIQHNRMKNITEASYASRQIVREGLQNGDGWQIWATLGWHLTHLAEAAPEEFLSAVENALVEEPGEASTLFTQDSSPFLGGTPHAGLLAALEQLAWSADYFPRVAEIIGKLAEIDPGGMVVNRPMPSLVELFRPWTRFTEATDNDRLTVLSNLTERSPDSGWEVLVEAFPSPTRDISNRNVLFFPRWQPWGPDRVPEVTNGERQEFREEMFQLLLKKVVNVTARWKDLLDLLPSLSKSQRQEVIKLLAFQVEGLRENPDVTDLRTAIRRNLHHHRSYPDSQWSMNSYELGLLDTVYVNLTPDDLIETHSWLFDNGPCLPYVKSGDYEEHRRQIVSAQQKAVREIYAHGGSDALLKLLRGAENPASIGKAAASSLDTDELLSLVQDFIKTDVNKGREFALSTLRQCFQQSDCLILDTALEWVKSSEINNPQNVATIYIAASPRDMATCLQRLASEDYLVQEAYWNNVAWLHVQWADLNEQDFPKALNYLLGAGRSLSAACLLAHRPMPSEVIVKVLERIPFDRARGTEPESTAANLDSYSITVLLEQLDAADEVSNEVIARLEIPYIHELKQERSNFVLYREILRVPSLFVELICNVFKHVDEQQEVKSEDRHREQIGILCLDILENIRELPGLRSDVTVDVDKLGSWVSEARRLCAENGRREIGDQRIGQILANAPADEDGTWPCEPVRDFLELLWPNEHIGIGFQLGKRNLRGVTLRGMDDGGDQERALTKEFRESADSCKTRWPFTASLLRQLADHYESRASYEDSRAKSMDELGI